VSGGIANSRCLGRDKKSCAFLCLAETTTATQSRSTIHFRYVSPVSGSARITAPDTN
jgi:hypothetical protein